MREYNVGAVYIRNNVYAGETNIPLLKGDTGYSISRVARTSGSGTPGSYDTYTIYLNTIPESIAGTFQVWNGTGNIGDMTKAEYDTDNDGIVDNAERVNNHTVDIDVPSNAKFTDTVYDDTAITNRVTTLENAGYITKSVSDLVNYYTKTETYTKQEVNTLVDTIPKFSIEVVNSLPVTDISTTTIYLVRDDSSTGDIYKEYIYVNNTWEILGTQRVDLSNYYNKTETNTLLNAKQDTLVSGTNIKTINNTSLVGSGNISIAGNEVAISDTQPTDTDNELWIDTAGTIPYINSEIAIGSSNDSNIPVWFKQSKNLLPNNLSNTTINGLTLTKNSDGSITISGTATAATDIYFIGESSVYYNFNLLQVGKTYCYSACPNNSSNYRAYATIKHADNNYDYNEDSGSGVSFTIQSGDTYRIFLRIVNGANLTTPVTFYPQITEGNTKLEYEPYVTPSINVNGEEIYNQNVMDYSITEQVVGKWVDGKPLYRKVVDFTISSTWQDVGTFSNVNFFTKIQFVRKNTGNAYPYYQNSDNYCYAYIPSSKARIIVASSTNESGNPCSLIVEYTKTTD